MGAKPSTANGGTSSPRARTFSASSSADVVASASGFSLLRALPGAVSSDRLRARSLSSVPDGHARTQESLSIPPTSSVNTTAPPRGFAISESPAETDSSSEDQGVDIGPSLASLSIGTSRVYAAHSLPSHIWNLNGIKCPVCSKFVLPDDIECHLVMCLTKPRLSYNEDVLTEDKGECVICLEDLAQGDTIARLPCLCIYHKGCIDRWFDVNRSCPEHPGD